MLQACSGAGRSASGEWKVGRHRYDARGQRRGTTSVVGRDRTLHCELRMDAKTDKRGLQGTVPSPRLVKLLEMNLSRLVCGCVDTALGVAPYRPAEGNTVVRDV